MVRHYRSMLDVEPAPTIGLSNQTTAEDFADETVKAIARRASSKKKRASSPIEHLAMIQGKATQVAIRPPGHMQTLNCQEFLLPSRTCHMLLTVQSF